jgi:hypothetical protein
VTNLQENLSQFYIFSSWILVHFCNIRFRFLSFNLIVLMHKYTPSLSSRSHTCTNLIPKKHRTNIFEDSNAFILLKPDCWAYNYSYFARVAWTKLIKRKYIAFYNIYNRTSACIYINTPSTACIYKIVTTDF